MFAQALRKFFPANGPAEIIRPPQFTSDVWKLEQFHRMLIFIADRADDEILKDHSKDGLPVYPVCYTRDRYTFWKKDLGMHSYSVTLPENYRPTGHVRYEVEAAPIKGRLWAIDAKGIVSLDNDKQNGVRFTRQQVDIILPWYAFGYGKTVPKYSQEYFVMRQAWIYLGVQEYWDAQIGGIFAGSQLETKTQTVHYEGHRNRNSKNYFEFEDR